jgi:GNAT superfamily N-acetyltransferase
MSTTVNAHTPSHVFRCFQATDTERCLAIFDRNCPEFFAPNERADYAAFLARGPGSYEVCSQGDGIIGAFGLLTGNAGRARIEWILLDPCAKGTGAAMMHRAIGRARCAGATQIDIAASHLSAPFFAKFGARTTRVLPHGWGAGMHRHDMVLDL